MPEAGFDLETIRIQGFNRDDTWKNLALPVVMPAALVAGLRIVNRFRPDVVLGMGGYVMAPAVAAARLRGIPYVLHEKDVRPGLATRMFAAGATCICTTLPGTEKRLKTRRTVLTGVPLRDGFEARTPRVPPRVLLITGGSQGARNLNNAVWGSLDALLERFEEVIHVAGRQGETGITEYGRERYTAMTFTDEMPSLMARADLTISRAGVGTIAEATAVGLPMVLVPGTFGGGHQEDNAAAMAEAGAAVVIRDEELGPAKLLATLGSLEDSTLTAMAAASRANGRRDAAQRVLNVLHEVAGN